MVAVAVIFGVAVVALLVYGIATHSKRLAEQDKLGLENILKWRDDWPPLTLIVDTDLVNREHKVLAAVKEAAQFWNESTGIDLFVGPDNIRREGHVIPIMSAPLHNDEHEHAIAYTRYTLDKEGALASAAVYLMPAWEAYELELFHRAMVHELGHCLGLAHDGIRESVMYSAAVPEAFVLTEKDNQFLRETYG